MMKLCVLVLIALFAGIEVCRAHSWIACTDYGGQITATVGYNASLCRSYIRGWAKHKPLTQPFGLTEKATGNVLYGRKNSYEEPVGQEINKGMMSGGLTCWSPKGAADNYAPEGTIQFPKATYVPGRNYTIVWPAKNHGGYAGFPTGGAPNRPEGCADNHGDGFDRIHIICGATAPDPPNLQGLTQANLAVDLKKTTQTGAFGATWSLGHGFKNCPAFCNTTEAAPCYTVFTMPAQLPVGQECSFYWFWELNPGEWYTSCWEATIAAGTGGGPGRPGRPTTRRPGPGRPTTRRPGPGPRPTTRRPGPVTTRRPGPGPRPTTRRPGPGPRPTTRRPGPGPRPTTRRPGPGPRPTTRRPGPGPRPTTRRPGPR